MKRTLIPIAALLIVTLTGCQWLQESTISDEAEPIITSVEEEIEVLEQAIAETQTWVEELEQQGEAQLAAQYRAELAKLAEARQQAEDYIAEVKTMVLDAETNGDVVLNLGAWIAAAFGIPYAGSVVQILKERKKFANLVANVEGAKTGGGTLQWETLKNANIKDGLQKKIDKIRKPG
jgi:vacuolar-type H+-ATPase subunit I/STV1